MKILTINMIRVRHVDRLIPRWLKSCSQRIRAGMGLCGGCAWGYRGVGGLSVVGLYTVAYRLSNTL